MSTTKSQTPRERLREIKQAVDNLSVTSPQSELDGYFWYADDPNYPNYYRISSLKDKEEGPLYDAYIDVTTEWQTLGSLHLKAEVVIFDAQNQFEVWKNTIIEKTFGGNNQPREQAFLNNFHHHKSNLKDEFETAVRSAEMYIKEDAEETDSETGETDE